MVGGGTIKIVKNEFVEQLVKTVSEKYFTQMNLSLTATLANIEDGTNILQ